MKKRTLSLLLCIVMCLSLMPMSAFAEENFEFRKLPTTGVTNITVPEGDYYTGVAAKDAFILYWDENIKTDGNFILIDYFNTYNNGYHSWTITIENGVPVATDGGFMEYYTTLDLINNEPFYASYDKWVNGTYSAIHTVTVQNDGNGTASADTSSAAKGDTVTLTATPNTGYHFKEWQSSDVTVSGSAFTMPEKDVTVKAVFEENTYTVTFNMNGHGEQIEEMKIELGVTAEKPADPTCEGFTFNGWYKDEALTEEFDFASPVAVNMTLYAKWTENTAAKTENKGAHILLVLLGALALSAAGATASLISIKRKKTTGK